MEVTPGAEIQDGTFNLFKVNFSKLSLVALIFLFLSLLPSHCSGEKIEVETATFFSQTFSFLVTYAFAGCCLLLQACDSLACHTNTCQVKLLSALCCDHRWHTLVGCDGYGRRCCTRMSCSSP